MIANTKKMNLGKFLVSQLGHPTGWAGRLTCSILNLANRNMNLLSVKYLEIQPGERVLDIGFGGGVAFPKLMTLAGAETVTGVEISDDVLRDVGHKYKRQIDKGRLELIKADVAALPFEDDCFHKILSVNTIYFWPDPEMGLREIGRVLKPGGRFALTTRAEETMQRFKFTQNVTHYSEQRTREMFKNTGLQLLDVKTDWERLVGSFRKFGIKTYLGEKQA